ncbi:MAG: hypothetical protein GF334_05600 [Candidatus Altiarchaeales archaeon]|nr:hypothetical protein [Candidatus Altiarchaeales archaeon]
MPSITQINVANEFVFLDHTADLRFRAEAKSLGDALITASRGLTSEILGEVTLKPNSRRVFKYEYDSHKQLVHDFLSDVLFYAQFEDYVPTEYKIKIKPERKHMKAETYGARHLPPIKNEIKAVTYHQMVVEEKNGFWIIEAVCDI